MPLLDLAPQVPDEGPLSIDDADVSAICNMNIFRGFTSVHSAADAIQPSAKRNAAALLVIMLRRLADHYLGAAPALRKEVREALIPDAVDDIRPWSTLNTRLYDKWNRKGFDDLLRQIVKAEQLQLARYSNKHTRVAAMQMLALLMYNSCVVA